MAACALSARAVGLDPGVPLAWGQNNFGQVSNTPSSGLRDVTGGEVNGYALRANGSIAVWGLDSAGQIANAPKDPGFTAITAGSSFACALRADGSIAAWGGDSSGQVSGAPTATGYTAIAAGHNHAYALAADGSISAWGDDLYGQVSGAPTGTGYTAIAAGLYFGCALAADLSIEAWGQVAVSGAPTETGFTAIAAGVGHGYALRADGSIAAWGLDNAGQVSGTPTGTGFTAIAAGLEHGYALAADGSISAWGVNNHGQVSNAPTQAGFTFISSGGNCGWAMVSPAPPILSFCDASDGALASCPCANPGNADAGCDNAQSTGGVTLSVLGQTTSPNGATLQGTGFSPVGNATAIVIRSNALDPASPVVFGDGLRCISAMGLVRLAATLADSGVSTHSIIHGAAGGPGTFYYQVWYRNTPSSFCNPEAYNLSNGLQLVW